MRFLYVKLDSTQWQTIDNGTKDAHRSLATEKDWKETKEFFEVMWLSYLWRSGADQPT